MTLAEFTSLNLNDRSDAIWEWGFFVSQRIDGDINKVLYAIHGFFAETYIRVSDNKVLDVKAFDKKELPAHNSYKINEDSLFLVLA